MGFVSKQRRTDSDIDGLSADAAGARNAASGAAVVRTAPPGLNPRARIPVRTHNVGWSAYAGLGTERLP